jgi:HSP20 family molecular chaperone IbpA
LLPIRASFLTALVPPVDVIEDGNGIVLRADLPGVPREKLSVQVEAETLTIEGEVSFAMPDGMEATYAEVSVPRFRRSFTLSKELDTGKVAAEFRHGVLVAHPCEHASRAASKSGELMPAAASLSSGRPFHAHLRISGASDAAPPRHRAAGRNIRVAVGLPAFRREPR